MDHGNDTNNPNSGGFTDDCCGNDIARPGQGTDGFGRLTPDPCCFWKRRRGSLEPGTGPKPQERTNPDIREFEAQVARSAGRDSTRGPASDDAVVSQDPGQSHHNLSNVTQEPELPWAAPDASAAEPKLSDAP